MQPRFTHRNTRGFSQAQLDQMNEEFEQQAELYCFASDDVLDRIAECILLDHNAVWDDEDYRPKNS